MTTETDTETADVRTDARSVTVTDNLREQLRSVHILGWRNLENMKNVREVAHSAGYVDLHEFIDAHDRDEYLLLLDAVNFDDLDD